MIHNVFNEDLLTKCKAMQFKEQHMDLVSLLIIINEKEEYEVEEVLKHRKQERETKYLVYWKGYGDEHNQWIAETVLSYAKEVIEDYWSKILSRNL